MKEKGNDKPPVAPGKKDGENEDLPGYPPYPPGEDIYSRYKEEPEIDPEETSRQKEAEATGGLNRKEFEEDMSGGDLDIPGAELDDEQEDLGSEDEENNLYSLGGDNHD
ncbi:MAG TPA: hypothetical protein VK152_08870 [Paludibacter sp.]|nr:hypothetical protein [Paludibacter sp.]